MIILHEDLITQARRHVSEAEQRVVEQRVRVRDLRLHGHDTIEAEKLLANFEAILENMRQHLKGEERKLGLEPSGR